MHYFLMGSDKTGKDRWYEKFVPILEKRTDIYISTLRSTIEAMGRELDTVARFPDGAIRIT